MNAFPFASTILEDLPTVGLSLVVAVLATYVALELAGRVHNASDTLSARMWLAAGAVAMGTGIWSMHFIGMSAATYPFMARFTEAMTGISWLVAVGVSAAALGLAGLPRLAPWMLVCGGVLAGVGATFMHFVGMGALDTAPAMKISPGWGIAANLVAIAGCTAVLQMLVWMRRSEGVQRLRRQIASALVFGLSLAGMHYLGMVAVSFDGGTICITSGGLEVESLGRVVGFASIIFLTLMLTVVLLERRAEARARSLDGSLNTALRELDFVTFNDAVTGLPNRLVFDDRLRQAVARHERHGALMACVIVELNGFHALNDVTPGSSAASILQAAAARLVRCVRNSDSVASAGASRFLVLAEELDSPRAAALVAEKIIDAFRPAVSIGDRSAAFTVTAGISLFPSDGIADVLLPNAATALEAARARGANHYTFFEPAMEAEAKARLEWFDSLRRAIDGGQFELHYQPKVVARTGKLAGAEALLRWHHPVLGMVSPVVFIPLAEQFGLINELGSWVIEEACRQIAAWLAKGVAARVAINLSVHQLRSPTLVDEIISALARHGVDASLLTCEITESAAMDDAAAAVAVFEKLQAAGVLVSIDDFGTGYSSLSYLRKLPLRQLKIDRSFVSDVAVNDDALSIVRGIIDLAHALRLEVVAEGVETAEQHMTLVQLGCDKLQGYLFAKPMSASAIEVWMNKNIERLELDRRVGPPAPAGAAPAVPAPAPEPTRIPVIASTSAHSNSMVA